MSHTSIDYRHTSKSQPMKRKSRKLHIKQVVPYPLLAGCESRIHVLSRSDFAKSVGVSQRVEKSAGPRSRVRFLLSNPYGGPLKCHGKSEKVMATLSK